MDKIFVEVEYISGDEVFDDDELYKDDVDEEGFIWFDYIIICVSFSGLVMFFYLFFSVVIFGF